MPRIVKCGLIQCSNPINDEKESIEKIQKAMFDKHLPFIDEAGKAGVKILGLQEIFNGPYFCPSQDPRWYDAAEPVPGPTVEALIPYAKKYEMVLIIPVYE
ncbi:MAG: acyltransferase, partial [Candidatus Marinimicrobia bacterium]|nr:acyltransferase [Candidatus Neomarinimicrobiota bacterium]